MKYKACAIATIIFMYASVSSGTNEDTTASSITPGTTNASVVETDHRQGLGPHGADLHVDPEAANSDAELVHDSLQDLPQLQSHPTIMPERSPERNPATSAKEK